MRYTVKQVATLSGVTVRTLHYYDQIALLPPTSVGENGYRYYDETALMRLQQILFFRELDFSLEDIRAILDQPDFDMVAALQAHREALDKRVHRLTDLIHTIDKTVRHLKGEEEMKKKELFAGFTEEKQQAYEQEAMRRYGERSVREAMGRWNSYSDLQKEQIKDEGGAIYLELATQVDAEPESPIVQALLGRWHQHLRHFYEPSLAVLRGLGNAYHEDADFNAFFAKLHPALPAFLQRAIAHYADALEQAELERELALLEA